MAVRYTIEELRNVIAPIARQHGVQSVSLFGSYSRGTAGADSDVDLKIEKGQLKSLFQICGFRLAVEDALKLPVDLVTSESSDRSFLDIIAKDEVVLYRNP
ncbi:MAG: nucleotidyltransferase [Lawsonibacter sp.]|jgi:predicted nucleotidyltransferase|nr:nucleotidyltransferase [Lawsonibacter sp.]